MRIKKVLLLGDASVGKTSVLNQFVNRDFVASYRATIGSDFLSRQIEIDDRFLTLQIWDTAGQERFKSLGPTFYRGTDCCIFVYDVTNPESFQHVEFWLENFSNEIGREHLNDVSFLLIGNKTDMPESRKVSVEAGRQWAAANRDMLFYEVSAKTSENVTLAFEAVVRRCLESETSIAMAISPQPLNLEGREASRGCC